MVSTNIMMIPMLESDLLSIDHLVICKAALIFGVTRWIFFWAQRFLNYYMWKYSYPSENEALFSESPPSADSSIELAREKLRLMTFGEIEGKLSCQKSCAVCLEWFRRNSQVWELCDCNHVFHRRCLDRWLRYDARMTCPLCRSPLIEMGSSESNGVPHLQQQQQPSWAVERILYLFGDDLLRSDSCS